MKNILLLIVLSTPALADRPSVHFSEVVEVMKGFFAGQVGTVVDYEPTLKPETDLCTIKRTSYPEYIRTYCSDLKAIQIQPVKN